MRKIIILNYLIIFCCSILYSQSDELQHSRSDVHNSNALLGVPQEVQDRCFAFFDDIIGKNYDSAFEKLLKDSPMKEKKEQLTNLQNQVKRSREIHGEIKSYEAVNSEKVTESLIKLRFLGLYDKYPLRWLFTFYKSPLNGWVVTNIKFDEMSEYYFSDE